MAPWLRNFPGIFNVLPALEVGPCHRRSFAFTCSHLLPAFYFRFHVAKYMNYTKTLTSFVKQIDCVAYFHCPFLHPLTRHCIASALWQSARIPYLSKSDEIGAEAKLDEIEGQKWKCVLRYTEFRFDRSRKNQKVRVPEYTFSLLPISLVHFGFCTNLVGFRFSSLNKLVERSLNQYGPRTAISFKA